MGSLIFKDLIIQKKAFLYSALYGLFILLVFSAGGGGMAAGAYIMGVVASTYIFIQTTMVIDDKNNTEIIFNSLPISRQTIVSAKYASAVIASVINLFIMAVVGFILSNLLVERVRLINYSDIMIGLASVWLLIVFYLPIYFRLGYINTKYFGMFFFFLFFFGPSVLVSFVLENPENLVAKAIMDMLGAGHIVAYIGGIVGITIAFLLLISMTISFRFYQKREF